MTRHLSSMSEVVTPSNNDYKSEQETSCRWPLHLANKDEADVSGSLSLIKQLSSSGWSKKSRRKTNVGLNLARKWKNPKRGSGKNAFRPDVIKKTIVRALKRYLTSSMKELDQDLDQIIYLNRREQLLRIWQIAMIIASNLINGWTHLVSRMSE